MRALVLAASLAAACYQPAAQPGAPCSPSGGCPAGQVCDRTTAPGVCVVAGGADGGADAPIECADATACPAGAPVCDTGVCRRCAADAECAAGVCRELTGRCVADAEVLFVSPAGADTGSTCTRAQPCATISHAVSLVAGARRTIRVGDGLYTEKVNLPNPDNSMLPIALSGEDASPAGATVTNNGEVASSDPSSVAELEGLEITGAGGNGVTSRGRTTLYRVNVLGSNGNGLDVRSGELIARECTIANGKQRGVSVNSSAVVDLQRVVVSGNASGGLELSGAGFTLVNSIVGGNGSMTSGIGGVMIAGGATALAFRFNTIAGNVSSSGSSNHPGVQCNAPALIDSSIVTNNGANPPLPASCLARYSLFSANLPPGEGNLVGLPAFASPTDFHITPASDARDRADPAATEERDVDNQPRADARRDIGADELQ